MMSESTATVIKIWLDERLLHLADFLYAAAAAALPACNAFRDTYVKRNSRCTDNSRVLTAMVLFPSSLLRL